MAGLNSLRGIEAGLATQGKHLYHLGATPINRSSLSYANAHRSAALFEAMFYQMLSKCQAIAPRHKFRFKNPLYSIDATVISLCLSLFNWAQFRKTKGAVKLHVKFNPALRDYLPSFALVTTGRVHERTVAPHIPLEAGDVVVFDRGFLDFRYLKSLQDQRVIFVTRLKSNSAFMVVQRRPCHHPHILADQVIHWLKSHLRLTGFYSRHNYPLTLRRIVAIDPETKKHVALLTNQFQWAASTIASIG